MASKASRTGKPDLLRSYLIPLIFGAIFIALVVNLSALDSASLSIQLTILLPELLVWIIASIGAYRFKKYASCIREERDGRGLNQIADALLLMVLYIIMLTSANATIKLFADTPYLDAVVIVGNHLPLLTALVSVILLLKGSTRLNQIINHDIWTRRRRVVLIASSVLFLEVFSYIFYIADSANMVSDDIPRFALPAQVLLATYILPHVALWFMGFKACLNLMNYANHVHGELYKALFKDLYRGILLTFICIFIAQFIIITATSVSQLSFMLALIYFTLALSIAGFVLILRGTKKLKKI